MTRHRPGEDDAAARSPDGDYEVGYGRPPKATRFRPGRSGNPKGRPKAVQRPADILRKRLNRTVVVQEHGQKRRMTFWEVILGGVVNDAARRDPKAIQMLLSLMRQLNLAEPEIDASSIGDISASDEAIVEAFLAQRRDLASLSEVEEPAASEEPAPSQKAKR